MAELTKRKRALIALRAMYERAKSISEVTSVKAKCKLNNVKYHLFVITDDDTFKRAMDLDQENHFYYEVTKN